MHPGQEVTSTPVNVTRHTEGLVPIKKKFIVPQIPLGKYLGNYIKNLGNYIKYLDNNINYLENYIKYLDDYIKYLGNYIYYTENRNFTFILGKYICCK